MAKNKPRRAEAEGNSPKQEIGEEGNSSYQGIGVLRGFQYTR